MKNFEMKLDITFDKENVYTNIFGKNLLLYTIIKNIKINENNKITRDEKKYLLEKTNFFNDFDVYNYHNPINIKEGINKNFNEFIITGFQEAIFKNDTWTERYCSKNIKFKNAKYDGLYQYIGTEKHICKSTEFKDDLAFNYFLENHKFNKFNYDDDFYTIHNNDIIIYKDGLLDILRNNLSDKVVIKNENLQNLIKYIFSDFSLDFKNDIKNLMIEINTLYHRSKKKKLDFDDSLETFLKSEDENNFFYIMSFENRLVSNNFLFNIPLINNFKIPEKFTDVDEIFFDFIANIIPLSKNKAIFISKKGLNFDINNFNIDSVNLLELAFLNTLMIDRFYRCKSDAESQKVDGGEDTIHYMNNSLILYDNNVQEYNVEQLIIKMSKGPERSSSVEPCILYTIKNITDNLNFQNNIKNEILLKKILNDLYEEN